MKNGLWRTLLQQSRSADRALPAFFNWRWAITGLAEDLCAKLAKKFHDAYSRLSCGWNFIFGFWHATFLFFHVSGPMRVCGLHDPG
jgi:hypothetical protein